MYGYIYKITNIYTRKIYIGQHKGEFDPKYMGSGIYIRPAIKKHGWADFKVEVITYANSKGEADVLEKYHIEKLKCIFPKGYNLAEGGRGGNHPQSEEARNKIRKGLTGKPKIHQVGCPCAICKAKRGETKGKNSYVYGKRQSKEVIAKRVAGRKGYRHSKKTIAKIRKSNLRKFHPLHSKETKEKMRLAHLRHETDCRCAACRTKRGDHPRAI